MTRPSFPACWLLLLACTTLFPHPASAQDQLDFLDELGEPTTELVELAHVELRLISPTSNYDPTHHDEAFGSLSSSLAGDDEFVFLRETGPDTGIFRVSLPHALAATASSFGVLETAPRGSLADPVDQVTATVGALQATATPVGARPRFRNVHGEAVSTLAAGEPVHVRVHCPSADDPNATDSIQVDLTSSPGDQETLVLTETSSGLFDGWLAATAGDVTAFDDLLQGGAGDSYGLSYTAPSNAGAASASAAVTASSASFVDRLGRSATTYLESSTAYLRVFDRAADATPLRDATTVTVASTVTGDSETVMLEETGAARALFAGRLPLTQGPAVPGNGVLETGGIAGPPAAFDTLTAHHADGFGGSSADATTLGSRTLFLDPYGQPAEFLLEAVPNRLRVDDHHLDVPGQADLALATLTVPGDAESLSLSETADGSGRFEGDFTVLLGAAATPGNGVIESFGGDLVARHDDVSGLTHSEATLGVTTARTDALDTWGRPTRRLPLGGGVVLRSYAGSENRDPAALDFVWVDLGLGSIRLDETAVDSGTFEALFDPVAVPGETFTLNGPGGQSITLEAGPGHTAFVGDSGQPVDALHLESRIRWMAYAPSYDADPTQLDTVLVAVANPAIALTRILTATETAVDSGVFVAETDSFIDFPAQGGDDLVAGAGDRIEAVLDPYGTATETATVTFLDQVAPTAQPLVALFVVDDALALGPGDVAVRDRLQALGYQVTVKSAGQAQATDADSRDVVLVSSTVTSSQVGGTFRDVTVPVLSWEPFILDDMAMTGPAAHVDYGSATDQTAIDVLAGHPTAAGASGTVQVLGASDRVTWGRPSDAAETIATVTADPTRSAIFAYDTYDPMVGTTAPARRLGFFLNDAGAATLTADGWSLFDAALCWTANCTRAPMPRITASATAGSAPLTVSFSAATSEGDAYPIVSYAWELGDGPTASGVAVDHTFGAGEHLVTLTVTDQGGLSAATTVLISVGAAPPPQALLIAHSTALAPSDEAIRARLASLGYAVEVKAASASASTDADGKAVVVVSSTVASSQVGSKFRDVAVPVLTWEAWIYDDLGMTPGGTGTGYGRIDGQSQIAIVDPAHPLAAGLSGQVAFVPGTTSMRWGAPAAGATVAATVPGDAAKALIFGFEAGDPLLGLEAPARRVGLPFFDDSAASFTAGGWALFDAAVTWATGD